MVGRATLMVVIESDHTGTPSLTWRLRNGSEVARGTSDDLFRGISRFVLIERGEAA